LAFRAAFKSIQNNGLWDLPKGISPNPLVDEVSREMLDEDAFDQFSET